MYKMFLFLQMLAAAIGGGDKVSVSLEYSPISGLAVQVNWPDNFHSRLEFSEHTLKNTHITEKDEMHRLVHNMQREYHRHLGKVPK